MSIPTVDSCIYKSVTLAAGEQFNLPPEAVLVSASNTNAITSNCAIPPLETPVCYFFRFSGSEDDGASTRNWALNGDFTVTGIVLNGVYYEFASPIVLTEFGSSRQAVTWSNAMNGISQFNGLFTFSYGNPVYGNQSGVGSNNGFTYQVTFSTIPSIGDNLEFKFTTGVQFQDPLNGDTTAYSRGQRCQ